MGKGDNRRTHKTRQRIKQAKKKIKERALREKGKKDK